MLQKFIRPFTSLRLTVTLLALGGILVFWGTLAQVNSGLYKVQNEFFRSFLVYWHPGNGDVKIPIFPGGYTLGILLLINLFAAHLRYYHTDFTKKGFLQAHVALVVFIGAGIWLRNSPWHIYLALLIGSTALVIYLHYYLNNPSKVGIAVIHLGIVLLLLGQLATDMLSQETMMHIREGQSANFSEAPRSYELAVMDTADMQMNKVVAIPERMLYDGHEITHPELPFTVRVKTFFSNSDISPTNAPGYSPVGSTDATGSQFFWANLPRETKMNSRDMPSGVVEISTPKGSQGTFFVSSFLLHPPSLVIDGRPYELVLRPARTYRPFSLHLIKFSFDRYAGTDIPKNFSSRVRLQRQDTSEDREVLIYMNSPLRYAGETFYQADWDHVDEKGTVLEVVHNPSWTTPYVACFLVAGGLIYQFLSHLIKFIRRRNA